jgi:AraC-like DNA-binding protein
VGQAWAVRRPHPAVLPLVSKYIGYEQTDVNLSVHRGLPSRHVTVIISLQEPVRVSGPQGAVRAPGLIGGLHNQAVLVRQDRTQRGLHLELNPFGVRTLFGVNAAELSGLVIGLDDLGVPVWAELPDRLASTSTWSDRFRILDDVFATLSASQDDSLPVAAELREAWRLMLASEGSMRIGDVADEIGWSRRHFGEKLRAETGITPKQAARILRFERVGKLLRQGRFDLAELALECGYYDQAHLSNEWRALAGCSPGTWISEELPFLQDVDLFPGEYDCHD